MEGITRWRVVDNDGITERSSNERHVFDEYTLEESAMLPEQPIVYDFGGFAVQDIYQRVCILAQTSCVYHYFIEFGKLLQKELCSWPYKHENVANIPFNLNWKYYIRFRRCFKT
jgi:hypothetical protein